MTSKAIINIENSTIEESIKFNIIYDLLNDKHVIIELVTNAQLLLKYYDFIKIDNKQYLLSYILNKCQIKENDDVHELIKKLINCCDILKRSKKFGTPAIQILRQKSFIFDMFYEKNNNILNFQNHISMHVYHFIDELASNELFEHILNKIPDFDYSIITNLSTSKQQILQNFQNKAKNNINEQLKEMTNKYNNLLEKYNLMEKQINDIKVLFNTINE